MHLDEIVWSRKHYYALVLLIVAAVFVGGQVKVHGSPESWKNEHIRSKRESGTNVDNLRLILGRLARLTSALHLQSLLQTPNTTVITHIGAEFVGLEGTVMDTLLSFDKTSLMERLNRTRTSSKLNVSQAVEVYDWLDKKIVDVPTRLRAAPWINNVTPQMNEIMAIDFDTWNNRSDQLRSSYEMFRDLSDDQIKSSNFSEWQDEFLDDLNFFFTFVNTTLAKVRTKSAALMLTMKPNLGGRVEIIKSILPEDFSETFPLASAQQFFDVFENNTDRLELLQIVRTLINLAKNDLPQIQRDYTGAFPSGAHDFDLLYEGLQNSDPDAPTFLTDTNRQDINVEAFQAIFEFRKSLEELKTSVLDMKEVPKELTDLLKDLEELTITGYSWNASLNWVEQNYKDSRERVLQVSKSFTDIFKSFDETQTAVNDTYSISHYYWALDVLDSKQRAKGSLITRIQDIKSEADLSEVMSFYGEELEETMGSSSFRSAISSFQTIQKFLGNLQKTYKEDIGKAEASLQQYLKEFADFWTQKPDLDIVKRCAQIVSKYFDPGFELGKNSSDYLAEFNTKLKDNFKKLHEASIQSSDNPLMDAWGSWSENVVTMEQLVAGSTLFRTFEEARNRIYDVHVLSASLRAVKNAKPDNNYKLEAIKGMLDSYVPEPYYVDWLTDQTNDLNKLAGETLVHLDAVIQKSAFMDNLKLSTAPWHRDLGIAQRHELVDSADVEKALNYTKKMADLYLDFASFQQRLQNPQDPLQRIYNFLDVNFHVEEPFTEAEPQTNSTIIEPVEKEYSNPWILLILIIVFVLVAWGVFWLVLWCFMKKKTKGKVVKEKVKKVPETVREELGEYDTFAPDDEYLRSQKTGGNFKEGLAARGKSTGASYGEKARRDFFRDLLRDSVEEGASIATTIQSVAEGIRRQYIEHIGSERAAAEHANYYTNANESFTTPQGRVWALLNHYQLTSQEVWQILRRSNAQCLINLDDDLSEYDQLDFCLNIAGVHGPLYTGKEVDQPYANMRLYQVTHNASGYVVDYWKYPDMPYGFAPFELTPTQVLYNWATATRGPNEELPPVMCMNRDADCRLCILPMIETILYVMETSKTFDELHSVGKWFAIQRRASIDLVTTAQIEFALYVSFKIIHDDSRVKDDTMYSERKSEFEVALENAWASAYIRNFKTYRSVFDEECLEELDDYDDHWWVPTCSRIVTKLREIMGHWEKRKEYERQRGHPDPDPDPDQIEET